MAFESGLEAFRKKHVERLTKSEDQVLGRRSAVLLVMLFTLAEAPVPVRCVEISRLVPLKRPFVRRHESEAGWSHQTFLRAGDGYIDAPRVHLERHGAERGDRGDHEQGGVAC